MTTLFYILVVIGSLVVFMTKYEFKKMPISVDYLLRVVIMMCAIFTMLMSVKWLVLHHFGFISTYVF